MNRRPPNVITIQPPRLPSWLTAGGGFVAVLLAALVLAALTSIYTVPQDSVGMVQRFGKFTGSQPPGLHFRLPYGIDSVTIVPVERQLKMEFGFATPGASNPAQASDIEEQRAERSMITGDRTVDEVLTIGRDEIESRVRDGLIELSKRYSLGIVVNQVQLKNVVPPPPVQAAFNEVNQAQQERESLINQARGEYNRAVPRAQGEADKRVAEAEGNAVKRLNEAEGNATRFTASFDAYRLAPEVTRQRLHLEAMQEILPRFRRRVLLDERHGGFLPYLMPLDPPDAPGLRSPLPANQ